jgi:hypothetical protein
MGRPGLKRSDLWWRYWAKTTRNDLRPEMNQPLDLLAFRLFQTHLTKVWNELIRNNWDNIYMVLPWPPRSTPYVRPPLKPGTLLLLLFPGGNSWVWLLPFRYSFEFTIAVCCHLFVFCLLFICSSLAKIKSREFRLAEPNATWFCSVFLCILKAW